MLNTATADPKKVLLPKSLFPNSTNEHPVFVKWSAFELYEYTKGNELRQMLRFLVRDPLKEEDHKRCSLFRFLCIQVWRG